MKLVLRPEDFGIKPMRRLPIPFKVGEKVRVKIVAPGWLKGEMLGVARGLAVTLVDARGLSIGSWVKARVIRTKDNILVARPMI
mgnify:FL=1